MIETLDPEVLRVLVDRAAALANRRKKAAERSVYREVTVVRRAGTTLGLPTQCVQEIRRVSLTALPHATDTVSGLFQIRGQVHVMLDIGPLLGASAPLRAGEASLVALIEGAPGRIGLRIDEAVGPRTVFDDELDHDIALGRNDFVAAVTRDLLAVVDCDALLARPEIYLEF